MVKVIHLGAMLAPVLLAGCAGFGMGEQSDFSCPGVPQGVICKSPREVYALTNGKNYDLGTDVKKGDSKDVPASSSDTIHPFTRPAVAANSGPMPVLAPSQVQRIWIGPWQDEKKDLNWPSYVFTEIAPRKWSFGGASFGGQKPLVPVQADFMNSARSAKSAEQAQPTPQQMAQEFAAPPSQ